MLNYLLCELHVLLFYFLGQLQPHHIQPDQLVPSILSFHICPHLLQFSQQPLSAGPLLWVIVQTLLHQLDQSRERRPGLQEVNILSTSFHLRPSQNLLVVIFNNFSLLKVGSREKVAWEYLKKVL